MIIADLSHVTSVQEFNDEIRRIQDDAHGEGYCDIHDLIAKYIPECNSYMEVGVMQGGTASAAMLANVKNICLVDVDLSKYRKYLHPLATDYCEENGITLQLKEADSRSEAACKNVDMLMIDTVHNSKFMNQELARHHMNVRKYIVAHDTSIVQGKPNEMLYNTLAEFADKHGWSVVDRSTRSAGCTVLKRND